MSLPPYHVSAFNTAKASENKIHDDATAQRFGFKGGFVGGVNVYAYMTHLPLQRWGKTWLEHGTRRGEIRQARLRWRNGRSVCHGGRRRHGPHRSQPGGSLRHWPSRGCRTSLPPTPRLNDYQSVSPSHQSCRCRRNIPPGQRLARYDSVGDHRGIPGPGSAGYP